MDPETLKAILSLVGIFSAATQGNNTQQVSGVEPSDTYSRSRTLLGQMSPAEALLASLQEQLARQALGAGREAMPSSLSLQNLAGGNVGGVTAESLAGGNLPAASQTRIHDMAFAGFNEALDRALASAGERALSRGVPMSSIQGGMEANLMQPIVAQAGQTQAQLQMQELDRLAGLRMSELERLSGLRDRSLSNMLALQDSPALNRLMNLRLFEGTKENLGFQRYPGGLPDYAYGMGGAGSSERAPVPQAGQGLFQQVGSGVNSMLNGLESVTTAGGAIPVNPIHWVRGWFK